MVLLSLLSVGLLSLSTIALKSSRAGEHQAQAQVNARMALTLAIAELQKAAGPDQRITSGASILSDRPSDSPSGGHTHWTGVWDSSDYDPKSPDKKTFVRWLVSSPHGTDSEDLAFAGSSPQEEHAIFAGGTAEGSVKVPKVKIDGGSGNSGAYAFWVEDEGIKADLGWNEGGFNDKERKQAARLESTAGPDYGIFKGPLASKVTYPISQDSAAELVDGMNKCLSIADIPLAANASGNEKDWVRDSRHDITLYSRGVIADVKLGGLRRDLSLAFEMDGEKDAENANRFNRQVGEFVGGDDRLASEKIAPGMPIEERFLWRDYNGSGSHFSGDMVRSNSVVRGPNWWSLRDYANLYKHLRGSSGDYSMEARTMFPNRDDMGRPWGMIYPIVGGPWVWDTEVNKTGHPSWPGSYAYKPARPNYTPVNLGTTVLVSMKAIPAADGMADLAVALDPLCIFWNPYNRRITCDNLVIDMKKSLPGKVSFRVRDSGGKQKTYRKNLMDLMRTNVTSRGNRVTFLVRGPLEFAPGEVVIVSPNGNTGEAVIGYATTNDSGIIMTKLHNNEAITIDTDKTTVDMNFLANDRGHSDEDKVAGRHEMDTYIQEGAPTVDQAAELNGDLIQVVYTQMWSGDQGVSEYQTPGTNSDNNSFKRTATARALTTGKHFFGGESIMVKPASPGGERANPVEMFSRFNPTTSLSSRYTYRHVMFHQISKHVAGNSDFAVREEIGLDFSGDPRNAYYGVSYQQTGSKFLPVKSIPSSPPISLAAFSEANLSFLGLEPLNAVGNSWPSVFFPPTSPYGELEDGPQGNNRTMHDFSWLANDALFDRYYLSGITPEFSITGSGYNSSGSIKETLSSFFDSDSVGSYRDAQANPALTPHMPSGESRSEIIESLDEDDGYLKFCAYAMIRGAFNVNSTSVKAWESLLRGNAGLEVDYADGGSSSGSSNSVSFPGSSSPASPGSGGSDPKPQWSGFPQLSESQVSVLAENIVEEVKLRGPFMSISDFVNHSVAEKLDPETSFSGALQSAIDKAANSGSGINAATRSSAPNASAVDSSAQKGVPSYNAKVYGSNEPVGNRRTTTGIPGDLTQAKLLLPLAPRLAARSDTFRIRAYGEALAKDGITVLARATCEAVVQRLPEYLDPITDSGNNEPWDEATNPFDPNGNDLNPTNQKFGRRFTITAFRWIHSNES
ncbi:MAG: hypothetical protein WBG04_14730 [Haloferula sp.]